MRLRRHVNQIYSVPFEHLFLNDIVTPIGSNYFKFRIKIEDITLNGSKEEADHFLWYLIILYKIMK